jgi:hypothetical protein
VRQCVGQISSGIFDEASTHARKLTSFACLHGDLPFSLYSYQVPAYSEGHGFDLSTNIAGQSIAIRVGPLGAIFINDGGLQMEAGAKGPFDLAGAELSRKSPIRKPLI